MLLSALKTTDPLSNWLDDIKGNGGACVPNALYTLVNSKGIGGDIKANSDVFLKYVKALLNLGSSKNPPLNVMLNSCSSRLNIALIFTAGNSSVYTIAPCVVSIFSSGVCALLYCQYLLYQIFFLKKI